MNPRSPGEQARAKLRDVNRRRVRRAMILSGERPYWTAGVTGEARGKHVGEPSAGDVCLACFSDESEGVEARAMQASRLARAIQGALSEEDRAVVEVKVKRERYDVFEVVALFDGASEAAIEAAGRAQRESEEIRGGLL